MRYFRGASLLLAPRGEFSTGALALKPVKKRWFLRVHRLLRLDRRVFWHASSAREAEDIQRVVGAGARVLVREDETDLPVRVLKPRASTRPTLRLAFAARITEMKGLHLLLEALHDLRGPVELSIFGSAEDEKYFARCESLMRTLPANVQATYEGWLEPEEVRTAISAFDLLVSPTSGENFGHIFAESLSCLLPRDVRSVTPWTPVLREGGGVVVQSLERVDWTAALNEYVDLSPQARHDRRRSAGLAYEQWRNKSREPHVYELIRLELSRQFGSRS